MYLALLDVGPAKARGVADKAGLGRTSVYRLLRNLADRGLVEVSSGSPMTFSPVSPRELFEELRRKKKGELEAIVGVVAAANPEAAVAFWTDAPSFHESHAHLFENLWAKARAQDG